MAAMVERCLRAELLADHLPLRVVFQTGGVSALRAVAEIAAEVAQVARHVIKLCDCMARRVGLSLHVIGQVIGLRSAKGGCSICRCLSSFQNHYSFSGKLLKVSG